VHDPTAKKAAPPAPVDLNPRQDAVLDFPDRQFGELTPGDYQELGFLCGLEVHQQLATTGKLFCRCPAGVSTAAVDAEVLRHMRPTLSEMGEYDGCALMEFKTRKEIVYLIERGSACTYELDDTPPFPIDEQAVRMAMQISRMFDLNLVSELHVMRKQYLDGSIPTGFQRTAMIGLGGSIPFRQSELGADRELRIRQLTLEEDSCREVEDVGHRITFRTDRLGMPLIETVTEPDLLTPNDVATGGHLLASVARASGMVRRGMGAARQDVNVSIAGSRRVEIKGVPQHRGLPLLVHNEAYRHLNLLRIRQRLTERGITHEMLELPPGPTCHQDGGPVIDARPALRRSVYGPIRAALDRGDVVLAVRLQGFEGLLSHPTQPGRPFINEFFERVRVIACLTGRPFMISSDQGHALGTPAWRDLRRACGAADGDAVIVIWGPTQDAATGAREVLLRAQEALLGVPSETRQAHADGTTGFERILPGPQRMYPDTDTPPLPLQDAWVTAAETSLAEPPWRRADRYRALGFTDAAARKLSEAPWADLFDELAPSSETAALRLATALEKRLVHHWRSAGSRELPAAERIKPLLLAFEAAEVTGAAFEACFDSLLEAADRTADEIIDEHRLRPQADDLLAEAARLVSAGRDRVSGKRDDAVLRWAMGTALQGKPRGQLDPLLLRGHLIRLLALEETTS